MFLPLSPYSDSGRFPNDSCEAILSFITFREHIFIVELSARPPPAPQPFTSFLFVNEKNSE